MKVKPLFAYVLIEPEKREEQTKSGIFIPDPIKKKRPEIGTVIEVGPGERTHEGQTFPICVKPGDKVLFSKYDADEYKLDDKNYLIVKEGAIFAIIQQDDKGRE